MVWSALSAASSQVASVTAASPLMFTAVSDRLALAPKPYRGSKKYYKSSSPDFVLSQTSIPKEVLSGSAPNIVLGSKAFGGACQTRSDMPFDLRVITGGGIFDTAGLPGGMRFRRVIRGLEGVSRFDLIAIQDGTLASVAWLNSPLLCETPFSGS